MSDIRDLLNKLKQLTEMSQDDVSAMKKIATVELLNKGISDNSSLNTKFAVSAENKKLQAELLSGVTPEQLELYKKLPNIDTSHADDVMMNIKLEAGEAVRQVPQDEKVKWVNEAYKPGVTVLTRTITLEPEEIAAIKSDLIRNRIETKVRGDQVTFKTAKIKTLVKILNKHIDFGATDVASVLDIPAEIGPIGEAQFDEAAGEKDACYRKVKSRYKVWPSAYASGALTKCRKVGASNWGNSKKK